MGALAELAARSSLSFGLLLFLFQLLSRELGFRLGLRQPTAEGKAGDIGVLVTAVLGLLSFVLALTLSFANARYDERRVEILAEASVIRTAWLRAEAVGGPRAADIASLLQRYNDLRSAYAQAGAQPAALDDLNDRTLQMQSQIWTQLTQLLQERSDALTAALMTALNETFSASTAVRFAFEYRPPERLLWLLAGMALVGMWALGYQFGCKRSQLRGLSMLLAGMWTVAIITILDLGAARLGTIRTDAFVYDWNRAGFRAGATSPPGRP